MPRAEVGSTKHLSNKLKSKGLQRLRWYCQVCEKQCRDANGFKMHTQSESHVRQMLLVGEDPKKFINEYSNQFVKDFIQLLKTGHGEKQVHINQFYQEYIANKEHIHMNATKWPSLTEFAKYLGRESICRVEELEKGIHISWIDNSPEALQRQEALRRKAAQDQGDEQFEQRVLREQIRRAQANITKRTTKDEEDEQACNLKRQDGEKIKISFASRSVTKTAAPSEAHDPGISQPSATSSTAPENSSAETKKSAKGSGFSMQATTASKPQTKNVFSLARKNALAARASTTSSNVHQTNKMSETENNERKSSGNGHRSRSDWNILRGRSGGITSHDDLPLMRRLGRSDDGW